LRATRPFRGRPFAEAGGLLNHGRRLGPLRQTANLGWVELLRNPSMQYRSDGSREQVGKPDLLALPILRADLHTSIQDWGRGAPGASRKRCMKIRSNQRPNL
jgi:hypothetical protein